MKTLLFAMLLLCAVTSSAFARTKIDSIYYLLDTSKTPLNDRIWDIHEEYPSIRLYTIKCACLQFNNQPSFVYNIGLVDDKIISEIFFKTIKLTTLATLINLAKQVANDYNTKEHYSFFLIEPKGRKYVLHHVRLLNPTKNPEPNIDYIILPRVDSAKTKKQ